MASPDPPELKPEAREAQRNSCPNCHSTSTRSLENLYDIARSYTRSSIGRVAVTGGAGFYLDGGNVRPTPETILAAKFPPPKKPKFSWWVLLSAILTVAFFFFVLIEWVGTPLWLALTLSIAVVMIDCAVQYLDLKKKMKNYRTQYAQWQKLRVCMDCESAF